MTTTDSIKRPETWIPHIARAAAAGLVVFCLPVACMSTDSGRLETATGALGAFSPWQDLATPKGQDGPPTIVQVKDKQVAFSATAPLGGFPLAIHFTSRSIQGTTGGAWAAWAALPVSNAEFKERPGAVAFDVPNGSPLAGMIALVGRKYDDTYHVRIQAPTVCGRCGNGTLLQNWQPIGGRWTSAPAVAFIPASSTVGPQNTLVIVGRGTDLRYYLLQNTLTAQNGYSHGGWTAPVPAFGNQTFTSAPAMTYACPVNGLGISLIVAGNSGTSMLFNTHNGFGFHPWETSNGIFVSGTGPALAVGCSAMRELTAYGIGTDHRIWVSPVPETVGLSWTPIGTTTFTGVAATGTLNTITVTGKTGTGTAPDFQAMATSAASPACAPHDFCGGNAFCELPTTGCTAPQGVCAPKPTTCPAPTAPVCGCDGITYGNDCERQAGGVPKWSDGFCHSAGCPAAVPSQGTGCTPANISCLYDGTTQGCLRRFTCTNGVWSAPSVVCGF